MADTSETDWQSGDKSGLVSIGTHKLFAQIAGPTRKAGDPLVIVVAGLGSTMRQWPVILRGCSPFARILGYDRTGLGRSEKAPTPSPRSGVAIAKELSALLKAMHLEPPYVLVAQSYGGVLARQFVAQRPGDVVGLCLLDTNQERTYIDRPIDERLLGVMLAGLDYYGLSGMQKTCKFSEDEWESMVKGDDGNDGEYAGLEMKDYMTSADVLAAHKQFENQVLGGHPVSVVRGNTVRELNAILTAGTEKGNGTEEQRAELAKAFENFADVEEKLQREQLRLSSQSRYAYIESSGHNVHMYEPDFVVDEIKWILKSQPTSS